MLIVYICINYLNNLGAPSGALFLCRQEKKLLDIPTHLLYLCGNKKRKKIDYDNKAKTPDRITRF
jgi:hypothetical protein